LGWRGGVKGTGWWAFSRVGICMACEFKGTEMDPGWGVFVTMALRQSWCATMQKRQLTLSYQLYKMDRVTS